MKKMNRRTLLSAAGLAAAGAAVSSVEAQQLRVRAAGENFARRVRGRVESVVSPLAFSNEEFYTDGKFDEEKAKNGILRLCAYHGYPVYPGMKEQLWVSDYGIGKFTELGLAAICMANNTETAGETYMLQDLFLLPGQMLPEHWHVKGENAIKNEGWFIRWGESLIVGAGEPNLPEGTKIPECHMGGTTETKHGILAKPGMFVPLVKVETKHWQMGGPEGCILTEVANLHENAAVRHNDKAMNDHFLGQ